jgi:cell division protein FtsI (penicillin-binding protein 3)
MKNAAVADVYEPGSVFKIVAVAAALQEGIASTRSTFDTTLDKFTHPRTGRVLPLPGEDHRFKIPTAVPLFEAVSYSSNRAAAQLGMALGEERFNRYARAFGFGSKLGFPVGGEVSGILRPLKKWDPIDITRIPIGHSISATALQMHQAMSVIANDGVLLRPQVIREVRDATGQVVFRYDAAEIGRVISADTARLVAQMLTGVASANGTAVGAAIDGYDVAGKTGTTIKLMDETPDDGSTNLVYNRKHHIASFVGFFPAGRPQLAISVIVDDADHKAPGGIAYGGKVAAPSFKRIGERLIPIRSIQSHRPSADLIAASSGGRR